AQALCNPPATFHRGLPCFQKTLIIPAPLLNPSGHSETFTRTRRPRGGSVVQSLYCMNDPRPEGHMASHIGRRKFLATLSGAAAGAAFEPARPANRDASERYAHSGTRTGAASPSRRCQHRRRDRLGVREIGAATSRRAHCGPQRILHKAVRTNRGAGGAARIACDLSVSPVRSGRWSRHLRNESYRFLSPNGYLHRSGSQGREAGRHAGLATDQVRASPQSQDRQDAGSDNSAGRARDRRRGDRMKRREFITLFGGAAVAWPLAARAQQPDRIRRIGVLMAAEAQDDPIAHAQVAAFRQELEKLGWTEGRNVRIDA